MKYLYHIMQILNGKPLHKKQGEIKMEDYIEELYSNRMMNMKTIIFQMTPKNSSGVT